MFSFRNAVKLLNSLACSRPLWYSSHLPHILQSLGCAQQELLCTPKEPQVMVQSSNNILGGGYCTTHPSSTTCTGSTASVLCNHVQTLIGAKVASQLPEEQPPPVIKCEQPTLLLMFLRVSSTINLSILALLLMLRDSP